jgi:hypothetical protein
MSTSKEVVEEKVPWIPIILLTIFYCLIGTAWGLLIGPGPSVWYGITRFACHMLLPAGAYLLTLIALSLRAFKPFGNRINVTILTYLYAIGVTVGYVGVTDGFPMVDWYQPMLNDRYLEPDLAERFWPWFWAPSREIIELMNMGGVAVPWAQWLPNIIWWGTLFSMFAVFTSSIGNIFRRGWIDVEKVPFPHVMVAYDYMTRIVLEKDGEKPLRERLGAPFLIGLLLGIAFGFPLFMTYAFPWFPDIYGWRANTCGTGGHQFHTGPFAQVIGMAILMKHPIYGAVFYLAPLKVCFSTWFWAVVYIILMQIAYYMGYYTGITDLGACGRFWCGMEITIWRGLPFRWLAFSGIGMVLGIVVMYFILNIGYVRETLMAALGKLSPERIRELEKNEATTYRNAYLTMVVSFLVLVGMMMLCDVSVIPAILMIFIPTVYMFCTVRVLGLAGLGFPTGGHSTTAFLKAYFGGVPEPMTREWMISVSGLMRYPFSQGVTKGFGAGLIGSLSSYRLASLTGVSAKSVYKVVLLASIVAPFIANITYIWLSYTFGRSRLPGASPWIGASYIDGWANVEDARLDLLQNLG